MDDPFMSSRRAVELGQGSAKQKIGLYRVHVDAQYKSLVRIEEAKAFAKAVKADDAEIPKHLWNNLIMMGPAPKEQGAALAGFR
jgi:hypothetical protein